MDRGRYAKILSVLLIVALMVGLVPLKVFAATHTDISVLETAVATEMSDSAYNNVEIRINRSVSPTVTLNDTANFTLENTSFTATGFPSETGFTSTSRVIPKSSSLGGASGVTSTFSNVATVKYPSQAYRVSDGAALDIVVNITSVSIETNGRAVRESPVVFIKYTGGQYSLWLGDTQMNTNFSDIGSVVAINDTTVSANVSFVLAGTSTAVTGINVPFLLTDIDMTIVNEKVAVTDNLAWSFLAPSTNLNVSTSGGMRVYAPIESHDTPPLTNLNEGANAVALITGAVSSFTVRHSQGTSSTTTYGSSGAAYELFPENLISIFGEDPPPPRGTVQVTKSSANTSITSGNDCYALNGAVYGVYTNYAAAQAGGTSGRVGTMSTNSSGVASLGGLEYGTYYVREITPPKGYTLNYTVLTATLNSALCAVTTTDVPGNDPSLLKVNKIDSETGGEYDGDEVAQMGGSLAGAEFTLRYYDGYYATPELAEASGTPTKTWVVVTDVHGEAYLEDDYLTPGSDSLYTSPSGNVLIPLGTVTTQETKAPQGYLLPDPNVPNLQQITLDGPDLEDVTAFNDYTRSDDVVRGDIALSKLFNTDENTTGIPEGEPDITFDFYAPAQYSGTTVNGGVSSPAFSITSDGDGFASTGPSEPTNPTDGIYVIENHDGTYTVRTRTAADRGGIPFGTYLVVQRNTTEGRGKLPPFLIFVGREGKTEYRSLLNGTDPSAIRIEKLDSETKKRVPYSATWQIIDKKTGDPVEMVTHYPTEVRMTEFVSDEEGNLTLPEKLPLGNYELKEILAPASEGIGYVLNPVNVEFSVEEYRDWDNPLIITMEDDPAKGQIQITKSDGGSKGGYVEDAVYTIIAATDIYTLDGTKRAEKDDIVGTIRTNEDGIATSSALYLGRYYVQEAVSPDTYRLDPERYEVGLSYEDQTVAVTLHELEVTDYPTELIITKTDSETGEPIVETEFTVVSTDDKEFEWAAMSDEFGVVHLEYIPQGEYNLKETKAAVGYASGDTDIDFIVNDQGQIEGIKGLEDGVYLSVEDDPLTAEILKVDPEGLIVLDAGLEIYAAIPVEIPVTEEPDEEDEDVVEDSDSEEDVTQEYEITGDPLYRWASTEEAFVIKNIPLGTYILHEANTPAGYVSGSGDVVFTIEDTSEVHNVVMVNDPILLDVLKLDKTDGTEIAGAKLAIYKVEAELTDEEEEWLEEADLLPEDIEEVTEGAIYEWTSTGEPHRIIAIPAGDYVLRETAAPRGYELAADVNFTVEDTSEVQIVTMEDERIIEWLNPKTADTISLGLLIMLPFMIAGIGVSIWQIRKTRRRIKALPPLN